MPQKSFLVGVTSFFGLLELPKSGKELHEEAKKLVDAANEDSVEAQKTIASILENEESPLHNFLTKTEAGVYQLTQEAEYESTRGELSVY